MKEKLEKTYSGTSLVCDCCGWRMAVTFKEKLHEWEDDWDDEPKTCVAYTKHEDMPFYDGDDDGSKIEEEANSEGWLFIDGKHYCPDCWSYCPMANTPDEFIDQYDDYTGLIFFDDGSVYENCGETQGVDGYIKIK